MAPALGVVALLALGAAPAGAADVQRTRLDLRTDARAKLAPEVLQARRALRRSLGRFAALSTDPQTGAVRMLARLDGSLTEPSALDGSQVARTYARRNARLLGLDQQDVDGLRLSAQQRLRDGQQLRFSQSLDGIPAIDSSLRAVVGSDGRLLTLGGSPRHLELASTEPQVSATRAHEAAARSARAESDPAVATSAAGPTQRTTFDNGDSAQLVVYEDGPALRLGWRVFLNPSSTEYDDVLVDARAGTVQRRRNLVRSASADVFRSYPGAPQGGVQTTRDITPFLDPLPATRLVGPNAHAVLDPTDAIRGPGTGTGTEVPPSSGSDFRYPIASVVAPVGANCPAVVLGCTWNPFSANSWQANAGQDATQLFYYVNTYHDHLRGDPSIGFDRAAGNFEGNDAVVAQAMDGAASGSGARAGRPDARHHSGANMLTLPDGTPGHLQTYLFDPSQKRTARGVSAANDATIVYHELTHGMLHRLVTDAQGFGALDGAQAGALDEGFADWYSLDFLVGSGQLLDQPGTSQPSFGSYPETNGLRTEPIGCLVGDGAPVCPGAGSAGPGGYTYGDLGKIVGSPQVHADGEIWGQTMWQLRRALIAAHGAGQGVERARRLITDALRLVPPYPSFLDMRNAILLTDRTGAASQDRDLLWSVFASRGMGYFASTEHGDDAAPIEDFSSPPAPQARTGAITGTVSELDGGPQGGVLVALNGHDTGLGDDLSATTAADGTYTIAQIAPRPYPFLVARGGGGLVEEKRRNVTVGAGTSVQDFALRRNLAASAAGGTIASFDGKDNSDVGCGPSGLIDSAHAVWGSRSPRIAPASARSIVVALPRAISLGAVEINPAAGCGDPPGASLGRFRVEASADGAGYTPVAEGTFATGDNGRSNSVALTAAPADVRFVKLVALDTQAAATAGDDGFMDVAEMAVFAARPGSGAAAPDSGANRPASAAAKPRKRAAVSCQTKRTRRRVRVHCRLRDRKGVVRASVRLSRKGRTIARARGRVRSGRLPVIGMKRTRRHSYRLTIVTRRSNGRLSTLKRSIKL